MKIKCMHRRSFRHTNSLPRDSPKVRWCHVNIRRRWVRQTPWTSPDMTLFHDGGTLDSGEGYGACPCEPYPLHEKIMFMV